MLFKRKHSAYMVLLLSYVSLLLVAISSLFVYYAQVSQQVSVDTQKSKLTMLGQLEDNINSKIKYADALMFNVISDEKLSLIAKGYEPVTYLDLMDDLQTAYKPEYLVDFSVYIKRTDEVVTQGMHMKAPEYYGYMYRLLDISYDDFASQFLMGYKSRRLCPTIQVQTFGKSAQTVIPYIQSFPVNSSEQTLGQIVVLINTKDIGDLIEQMRASTRSYVYVINSEQQTVFSSGEAPELPAAFVDELRRSGETYQTKMDNGTVMVSQVTSTGNSWKYVIVTPQNVYFQENSRFAVTCVIIFLVYLALGLLIVRFLAKRSYQPIKEIKDMILDHQADVDDSGEKNEYHTIKNVLLSQFKNDEKLNEIIQDQMPIVRQSYFISLIKGLEVNYDEVPSKLAMLGVKPVSNNYLIASLELDLDSPFFMEEEQFAENNFSLARVIVQNVGGELMEQNQLCYFLDLDRNESALLLNVKEDWSPQEALNQFKSRLNTLIAFASTNFKLNINIGISMVHSDIKSLPKCYDESRKALENSKKRQNYVATWFGEDADIGLDYYFTTDVEYQLVNLLKKGSYRECKDLLENIFEINRNSYTVMSDQARSALINDIASTLVRVMNSVLAAQKKPTVTNESLIDEFAGDNTLEQAEKLFSGYIDRIANAAKNRVVRKTELLVNNIVEFIDANAGENWLDLNYLSRKFEITPQYISNIFKKYKKENIKDYISKLKLERAKELLVTTNLSLLEISTSLGYVNELGIFRLFRKYENTTPGEYRVIHKKPS